MKKRDFILIGAVLVLALCAGAGPFVLAHS